MRASLAGMIAAVLPACILGCDDGGGGPCADVTKRMYEEGCELHCEAEQDWKSNDCSWRSGGGSWNLALEEAIEVCETERREAERGGCGDEFLDILSCLLDGISEGAGCVESCEEENLELLVCITGSSGQANVVACEDWLASLECGETDFSGLVDCSVYADYPCDISDYFNCLAEEGSCDEDTGVYDSTGWADCADLATCD
ncbi:MAG: hypothetical protein R6V85_09635 [Polyangia bacterium]